MTEARIDGLIQRFKEQLTAKVNYPSFYGYYGWNYEAAVALEALLIQEQDQDELEQFLNRALKFPHAGYYMKKNRHAAWLYSVGDRIGLFGALYKGVDDTVYKRTIKGIENWPRHKGLFLRNIGWGPVFGIRPSKVWIWADDIFMGGIPLLKEDPDQVLEMLKGADEVLRDPADGAYWHGVKINSKGEVIANNKQKWGRASAWIVMTLARYADVVRSEESYQMLQRELEIFKAHQRESGAFGNLLNVELSHDESSLTSAYVYAAGVLNAQSPIAEDIRLVADKAWKWLCTLESKGFHLGKTAGACHISNKESDYNAVVGLKAGPAVAFILWAKMGRLALDA